MTTPFSFADTIRVRLLAHIAIKGTSLTKLSKDLGCSHSYLGRKLNPAPDGEARDLSTKEIDPILLQLGLPVDALFTPAFGPGDQSILTWFATSDRDVATEKNCARIYAGVAKAVERLLMQGLLVRNSDDTLSVTAEGMKYTLA